MEQTRKELAPQLGTDYYVDDKAIYLSHDYIDSDKFIAFDLQLWLAEMYLKHFNVKPTNVALAGVMGLSPSNVSKRRKRSGNPRSTVNPLGYVYVLRAGPYHKIGHSVNVDRRITEVATLLPWEVELVHTIKSDNRIALEAYLHKRFKGKRRNGEWFELDEEDVTWLMTL